MKKSIEQTAFSLGLLCQGCEAQAYIVGFRNVTEAYAFAKIEIGWWVDDGMVFCPLCRPEGDLRERMTNDQADLRLAKRVHDAIVGNRPVECSEREWPQVSEILEAYIRRAVDDSRYVYANIAQDEHTRLEERYGRLD